MSTPPPAHVPGEAEQRIAQRALCLVLECAKDVAADWRRFVGEPEELHAVGTMALYHVVHEFLEQQGPAYTFHDELHPDFVDLARYRLRYAMVDSLRIESRYHEFKRAVEMANQRFLAEYDDPELNVLVHHEEEAEKRMEPFLDRVLAATFAGGMDAVLKYKGEDAAAVQQEYTYAIQSLRRALPKVPRDEAHMILLVYSKGHTIGEASEILGITYIRARRTHERALDTLHKLLVAWGVTRAPPPIDVPGVGSAFAVNDTAPPDGGGSS